jgi:hypothetical protein
MRTSWSICGVRGLIEADLEWRICGRYVKVGACLVGRNESIENDLALFVSQNA